MEQEFKITPLTRVEGHGNVIIRVRDGRLSEVELNIVESPRFFEKFLEGKPAEEAPRISERICGICFVAHHMASVKAVESAWNVEVPEAAWELRELLNLAGFITSHTLHLAFLALPDLLDLPPEKRHILGLGEKNPALLKQALAIYDYGLMLTEILGGKRVHVATAIPGGMSKIPSQEEREKLLSLASAAQSSIEAMADWFMENAERKAELLNYPVRTKYCMGLVKNGAHELYDGNLRVVRPDGGKAYEFRASEYLEYVAERVSPHSHVKLPYLRKVGFPDGVHRVGPLARLAVADRIRGDLAPKLAERYYKFFGKVPSNMMAYNAARFVELAYAVEASKQMLEEARFTKGPIRVEVKEKAGEGVGVVEAPRGVLIHHYKTDEQGLIRMANVITPTAFNAPSIEQDLAVIAENTLPSILGGGREETFWKMEVLTRAYDPCISCATHTLKIVVEESP
ncbi:MAG: Ni/Fe hydrogenase subunit alpha [Candidatus Hecatellales archaeon]|nr:MAG: Ni/Fe hydrogenase subunit alpha [Candidatus Hecatellales archaeon]